MSILGNVPEKDGILGACLVIDLVTATGTTLTKVQEKLFQDYGSLVSTRWDVHVKPGEKQRVLEEVKEFSPGALDSRPVVSRITMDGTKLVADDGSWVLIRPSGTEPIFRIYAEANSRKQLEGIHRQIRRDLRI